MSESPSGRGSDSQNGAVKLPNKMPTRPLGRTGVEVSLLGLGGYHLGFADEKTAVRIVRTAIDSGMTFLDNCWDYNDGRSHVWMGRALRDGYRQRAFLMTKIDGRTKASAAAQIDQSLRDLGTDVIDLMQIHEVIRDSDITRSFAPDGAVAALIEARQAGKIRFIGFTGHKNPRFHLGMLDAARAHGFTFDAVQLPLNVLDAHYDSFAELVLPALVAENIGVIGMKPFGAGSLFRSGVSVTAKEALHYAMSLPTSVVVTGCDSPEILTQALDAGYTFQPLSDASRRAILARSAPPAAAGKWEGYKTTDEFDGTAANPHWLDSAQL